MRYFDDWNICNGYVLEESVAVDLEVNKCCPNDTFLIVTKYSDSNVFAVQCSCGRTITKEFNDPEKALDAFYNGEIMRWNGGTYKQSEYRR